MDGRNLVAVAAVLSMASPLAHSGLLGDQIHWQYYAYGDPFVVGGSPGSFVAGSTTSSFADTSANYFTVSATDTQITFTDFGAPSPWSPSQISLDESGLFVRNGVVLYGFDAPITNVSIAAQTVMVGMSADRITYTPAAIAIDWAEVGYPVPGGRLVLNVSVVPEPASALMLSLGLLCVASLRRWIA